MLSHTNTFTVRGLYPRTLLHADAFTRRCILHTDAFTQTQTLLSLLHRKALTCFDTQTPEHREAFTHKRLCTQKLLHTDDFTHRHF